MSDVVEYEAISFKFRPVAQGEIAPEYTWTMHEDGSLECTELPNPYKGLMTISEARAKHAETGA